MLNTDIHYVEELVSTSSYLKDLIEIHSVNEGYTVYSGFQLSGRGQRGNSWESERGQNLMFSVLLKPEFIQVKDSFLLSQIISLSVYDVLNQYIDQVSIKWTNDIYWKDMKIAGILIENSFIGNIVMQSIAGIGLNLNQQSFVSNAPNPISLSQITGDKYDILSILSSILEKVSFYYQAIQKEGDFDFIRRIYKKALYRKEGFYTFEDLHGSFLARIKDIDNLGLLILETNRGESRSYGFKEVKYIL